MLKFTSRTSKGTTLIGIGLTDENIKRLRKKKPILFDMAELGLPGTEMLIWAGKTTSTLKIDMLDMGLITDKTEVTDIGGDKT